MSALLSPTPVMRFYDNNNNPLAGGQLWTYQAGTTTPVATYTDSTAGTQNTNPVILNARGEAPVWLSPVQAYKFVLQDASGNTIWTADQITSPAPVAVGNMVDEKGIGGTPGFAAGVDFTAGTTTSLTLSTNYGSASNLWVAFDGVEQGADSFTLSGTTLTFNAPIPIGTSKVYVKGGTALTIGAPGGGTVTDSSVAAGSRLYNRVFDLYDLRDYGAKCDGTTDDTAAVTQAIASIGNRGASLLIPGPTLVSANITFGSATSLLPINGGYIKGKAGTEVVKVSLQPTAGPVPVFLNCVANATSGTNSYPEWFGAVGDGATDDLPAFKAYVAYLTSIGSGVLLVPPRAYFLSNALTITNANIEVRGMDRHNSQLVFGPNATNGLVFSLQSSGAGADFNCANVSHLSVLTQNTSSVASAPGITAISYLPSSPQQGSPYPTVKIHEVDIRGQNMFSQFWQTGIYLNNVVNAIVDDANVIGKANFQTMYYGLYTDLYAVNVQVTNSVFNYMATGISMYSNVTSAPSGMVQGCEGLQVIGCQFGGVNQGVIKDNGTTPQPRPLTLVVGCHINATQNCVYVSNCTETVITGNLFYLQDTVNYTVQAGAVCVFIGNPNGSVVNRHTISGCLFRSLAAQTQVRGLSLDVGFVTVGNCVFDTFDYGLILSSHSNTVSVNNLGFNNISQFQIQNAGAANWYSSKTPMATSSSFNIY